MNPDFKKTERQRKLDQLEMEYQYFVAMLSGAFVLGLIAAGLAYVQGSH